MILLSSLLRMYDTRACSRSLGIKIIFRGFVLAFGDSTTAKIGGNGDYFIM